MPSETVEITLTIPKRFYDIALEIESLPEVTTSDKGDYSGTPKEIQRYNENYESFEAKVKAIYKREKITTTHERKAVQRARKIMQLLAGGK